MKRNLNSMKRNVGNKIDKPYQSFCDKTDANGNAHRQQGNYRHPLSVSCFSGMNIFRLERGD